MIVCGVDPGKRTGYCFFDSAQNKIIDSGVIDGDDFVCISQLVDSFSPDVIVVEDQFLGRSTNKKGRTRFFANTYAKLKFYLYAWERVAKEKGIRFAKPVNPSTWQSYWKLEKGDKEGMRRLVANLYKNVKIDEADAVLIAVYFAWSNK